MDDTIIEVWVNCPDDGIAANLAETMVDAGLAAAANIYPPIESRYRWKGRTERTREVPLLLKTRRSLFERLAERVAECHPYETPSILGKEISHAPLPYRRWLLEQTHG